MIDYLLMTPLARTLMLSITHLAFQVLLRCCTVMRGRVNLILIIMRLYLSQ